MAEVVAAGKPGGEDGNVYRFSPNDGTVTWQHPVEFGSVESSPCVAVIKDRLVVYIGSDNGGLSRGGRGTGTGARVECG
jgi:outer membrane protein assembly factor BamB